MDPTPFDDFEDDGPDDTDALEGYVADVVAVVDAFGIEVPE